MLKEAISVAADFFLPLIQKIIQLAFLSLYIKSDIFLDYRSLNIC